MLDPLRPADWPAWRQLMPHLSALLGWLATYLEAPALISLLETSNPAVDALWCSGNLAAAEELARASARAAPQLGDEHPIALASRHALATAIAFQGRYSEGEEQTRSQEALQAARELQGDRSGSQLTVPAPELAAGWLARYEKAEQMYRQLLRDEQRVLGEDHPGTLSTRHRLAWVIGLQGRHRDS